MYLCPQSNPQCSATLRPNHNSARTLADHFFRLNGEDAYPLPPGTSAADIAALQRSLHRQLVTCNETVYRILLDSGRVPAIEDLLQQEKARAFKAAKRLVPVAELTRDNVPHTPHTPDASCAPNATPCTPYIRCRCCGTPLY